LVWIGYNELAKEGNWVWSDNSPAEYQNWNKGEPNNWKVDEDCALINLGNQ